MREQAFKIDEKFTYQDYIHLPDNGKRYQVIKGELYRVPAPVPYHQRILARVFKIVDSFVSHENLGAVFISPCDVILSDTDIVQPDLFFIGQDRLDIMKERNIQGAPDLVVEVLSPHSEKIDKISKTKLYARFGVKEYWILSPDNREVTVLKLRGENYRNQGNFGIENSFKSPLLKGLTVKVSEIFQP